MNAWQAAHSSAMTEVIHHNVIARAPLNPLAHHRARREKGKWKIYGFDHGYRNSSPDGTEVGPEVFEYSLKVLYAAEKAVGDNYATPLALLHQASYQFENHRFSSALIEAWTVSEVVLNILWKQYQAEACSEPEPRTLINKERRDLLNGRDFTASIKSQALSLSGRISDELLTDLHRARKSRNDFMHKLIDVDSDQAAGAVRTASKMLSKALELPVTVPLGFSIWA